MMVTTKGYSVAAINRAYYGPHKLEVEILNFDALLRHQSTASFIYSGKRIISLSAPFGWVIDFNKHRDFLVCLYRRGIDLVCAQKELEWMYCNIYHKTEDVQTIENLVEAQNDRIRSGYWQICRDNDTVFPERTDRKPTFIRIAKLIHVDCLEITGYVDFGNHIFFAVMFTKPELKKRNLKKLIYIMKYASGADLHIDNKKVIAKLQKQCDNITNPQKKADAYRQIADWYMQMDDFDNAMKYRRLCWKTFPHVYDNIAPLIDGELARMNLDQAIEYSTKFFAMDPTNPRVMQDLLRNYRHPLYAVVFARIVSMLKSEYHDNNAILGNISFHYGVHLVNFGCNRLAIEQFVLARKAFCTINCKEQLIEQIDILIPKLSESSQRIQIELGNVIPSYYTGAGGLALSNATMLDPSSGIDLDKEAVLRKRMEALADVLDTDLESDDSIE